MSDKPIQLVKAKRKAFDKKELAWSLVETMSAEQLSIYLGESVTDKAELHELFGDDYLKRSFEIYMEKVTGNSTDKASLMFKDTHFECYKQAFLAGVTAHANGNYY